MAEKLKSNLKYLRKSKGFDMTQEQLAKELELTVATIYKIENGRGINIRNAKKIADFFGVKIEDLYDFN